MYGEPLGITMPGYAVRTATSGDEAACNALCVRVHGHDRAGELREAVADGRANVVERLGRITGSADAGRGRSALSAARSVSAVATSSMSAAMVGLPKPNP